MVIRNKKPHVPAPPMIHRSGLTASPERPQRTDLLAPSAQPIRRRGGPAPCSALSLWPPVPAPRQSEDNGRIWSLALPAIRPRYRTRLQSGGFAWVRAPRRCRGRGTRSRTNGGRRSRNGPAVRWYSRDQGQVAPLADPLHAFFAVGRVQPGYMSRPTRSVAGAIEDGPTFCSRSPCHGPGSSSRDRWVKL